MSTDNLSYAQDNITQTLSPSPTITPTLSLDDEFMLVYQVIIEDGVWLRTEPSSDSVDILDVLDINTIVFDEGKTEYDGTQWWIEVSTIDYITGWVEQNAVVESLMILPQKWNANEEIAINDNDVWLRLEPDSKSENIIEVLAQDETVTLVGGNYFDGIQWWWQISTTERNIGWIEEKWLEISKCIPRSDWSTRYIIQRGDTIFKIASSINISIEDLASGNCLDASRNIVVGQQLVLPSSYASSVDSYNRPPDTAIPNSLSTSPDTAAPTLTSTFHAVCRPNCLPTSPDTTAPTFTPTSPATTDSITIVTLPPTVPITMVFLPPTLPIIILTPLSTDTP